MKLPEAVKVSLASLGLGGALGIVFALLVLGGECSAWRQDHPKPAPPVTSVLPPTPGELATPSTVLPCVPVKVLQPSPKRLKEIVRETGGLVGAPTAPPVVPPSHLGEIVAPAASGGFGFPLLLVDGRPYPESPAGGKLWVRLEADGETTVVVKPNEPKPLPAEKFFQFANVWELGGLYGVGQGGDVRSRAWAALEPVRLGRIHVRGEVGVDLRGGEQDGYAMAGFVYRSR